MNIIHNHQIWDSVVHTVLLNGLNNTHNVKYVYCIFIIFLYNNGDPFDQCQAYRLDIDNHYFEISTYVHNIIVIVMVSIINTNNIRILLLKLGNFEEIHI